MFRTVADRPNIARIAIVVLLHAVLATGGCITPESWEAVRVVSDIEAGGNSSQLKSVTPKPGRTVVYYPTDGATGVADLYEPNQPIGAGLVLVPGFTAHGKDDARLVELALSLARARFLVLVPDLPGSRDMKIRLEDARRIADAAAYLAGAAPLAGHGGVGVVAISYSVGLAVLASTYPRGKESMRFIVGIGGYYDTTALATYITTGHYRAPLSQRWKTADPHPAAKWIFLSSNIDFVDDASDREILTAIVERQLSKRDEPVEDLAGRLGPEGRALWDLLTNGDPRQVQRLLDRLPDTVRRHVRELSLRNRDLSHLAGRLVLIHGRADTLIPYTESLALSRAVPDTEVFVIDGFSHIDPTDVTLMGRLRLVDAMQAVLRRRRN